MLFFWFPVPTHSQCLMERLWSVVIREPAGAVIKSDTFSLGGGGGGGGGIREGGGGGEFLPKFSEEETIP